MQPRRHERRLCVPQAGFGQWSCSRRPANVEKPTSRVLNMLLVTTPFTTRQMRGDRQSVLEFLFRESLIKGSTWRREHGRVLGPARTRPQLETY